MIHAGDAAASFAWRVAASQMQGCASSWMTCSQHERVRGLYLATGSLPGNYIRETDSAPMQPVLPDSYGKTMIGACLLLLIGAVAGVQYHFSNAGTMVHRQEKRHRHPAYSVAAGAVGHHRWVSSWCRAQSLAMIGNLDRWRLWRAGCV